jgi:hypothetical protein
MEKKDKNQSALVATTLLLGTIFAVSIVINGTDVPPDTDIVGKTYTTIQSKGEQSVDATSNSEPVQTAELAEDDILAENVNIESVEITSGNFAVAFKQARVLLGPNNTFVWNGMIYTTNLADEKTIPLEQNESVITSVDLASEMPKIEPTLSQVIETTP